MRGLSGLSELGIVTAETVGNERLCQAVGAILRQEEERVRGLIAEHREVLLRVADRLAEEEVLAGEEFRGLLAS